MLTDPLLSTSPEHLEVSHEAADRDGLKPCHDVGIPVPVCHSILLGPKGNSGPWLGHLSTFPDEFNPSTAGLK